MASDFANNPYATPSVDASMTSTGQYHGGIFRQGDVLIVHRLAQFPPYCVRTNEPTSRFDNWTFRWHPQWVYLLVLLNILIFALVAMAMTKTIKLQVPVSDYWRGIRFQRILIGWLIAILGSAFSIVIGFLLAGPQSDGPSLLAALVGPIVFVLLGLFVGSSAKVLTPNKIEGDYAWLKGACPAFLDRFPNA